MSTLNFFDIIVFGCGLYMVINGIQMKVSGKINTGLVLARNTSPDNIKDKEGFIAFMWSKLVVIGAVCALSGVVNIWLSRVEEAGIAELIINALFFVILIIYGVVVTKAQKKFIH